jgi:hypothetical protein
LNAEIAEHAENSKRIFSALPAIPALSRGIGAGLNGEIARMMAADVRTAPALEVSTPRTLFEGPYEVMDRPINYDITPDGRRFLMVKMERAEAPTELRVVTGWNQEVRKALPVTP